MATGIVSPHFGTTQYAVAGGGTPRPLRWLFDAFSQFAGKLLSVAAEEGASGGNSGTSDPQSKTLEAAGPMPQPIPQCCTLYYQDRACDYPSGQPQNYICPPGYHRQWWHCCEGTHLVGCGECTTDTSTCWEGSFACSIWWNTSTAC
jgi:hypothetical protein